jgi:hypothetical protein
MVGVLKGLIYSTRWIFFIFLFNKMSNFINLFNKMKHSFIQQDENFYFFIQQDETFYFFILQDAPLLLDNDIVRIIPTACANDSTALKPSIQFDERLNVNVGLQESVDYTFVTQNPSPDAQFLKDNVVTEVNVTSVSSMDDSVSLPVGVTYKPRKGKTGAVLQEQFLNEIKILQTCLECVKSAVPSKHIISLQSVQGCVKICGQCIDEDGVCADCAAQGQISHLPAFRACVPCVGKGVVCVHIAVLVYCTDCEQGNKNAMEAIIKERQQSTLSPEIIAAFLPEAIHVGKSMKASFANWPILLNSERSCLAVVHTLHDTDPELKKVLRRDAVQNKDRMDVDCILHLSKPAVLQRIQSVSKIVHTIVPDKYAILKSICYNFSMPYACYIFSTTNEFNIPRPSQ